MTLSREYSQVINLDKMAALRRCRSCAYEDTNSLQICPECSDVLITVVFSALGGERITPTYQEELDHENEPPTEFEQYCRDLLDLLSFKRLVDRGVLVVSETVIPDDDIPF